MPRAISTTKLGNFAASLGKDVSRDPSSRGLEHPRHSGPYAGRCSKCEHVSKGSPYPMSHVMPRLFYVSATDPTAVCASITLALRQADSGATPRRDLGDGQHASGRGQGRLTGPTGGRPRERRIGKAGVNAIGVAGPGQLNLSTSGLFPVETVEGVSPSQGGIDSARELPGVGPIVQPSVRKDRGR